tara:strand:+ start:762 stop:2033 length:1272 start_codon:yes stop_codon:yes gene_type:complete
VQNIFIATYRFKNIIILAVLTLALSSIMSCKNKETGYEELRPLPVHANGEAYAGSEACAQCHKDIHKAHIETAHYKTSAKATKTSVLGPLEVNNYVKLQDAVFEIREHDGILIETATGIPKGEILTVDTIGMVMGSGVKGQTYLTWKGDRLYQLQPSFYVPTGQWITSPGYPDVYVDNKRMVTDQCLKCHVTYAVNSELKGSSNFYPGRKVFQGVQCERCHNPAQKHVNFHLNNPAEKNGKFITRYVDLSRERRMDACAQCHSGLRVRQLREGAFSFQVGDTLAHFNENLKGILANQDIDVHGNQVGLLMESACFKASDTMDCMTCHSPHENERGMTSTFNNRCITCHSLSQDNIVVSHNTIKDFQENCITCHMPLSPSKAMKVQDIDGQGPHSIMVRTHKIAVYSQVINIQAYVDDLINDKP